LTNGIKIKLKTSAQQRKQLPEEMKKIFDSYSPERGFISRIHKKLQKLNSTRTNNPVNKWANKLNR
jgi:hypothetical protein